MPTSAFWLSLRSTPSLDRGIVAGLVVVVLITSSGCSFLEGRNNEPPSSAEPGMAVISWQTRAGLKGCNVYRVRANGTEVLVNSKPIRPLAPAAEGQLLEEYRFLDRGLIAGRDYYYTAEGIGDTGRTVLWEQPRMITAIPLSETETF